jgi:hypothetical protein
MLLAAVALAACIPALALIGVRTTLDSQEGRTLRPDTAAPVAVLPDTPAALLVQVDDDGGLDATTVIALAPGGRGGHVIIIPVGTEAGEPTGAGAPTLAGAYEAGGVEQLARATEALLGARLSATETVDPDRWERWADDLGGIRMTLPEAVEDVDPTGAPAAVFPAGEQTIPPELTAPFLAARGPGEVDLARLARHHDFWGAWVAAVADVENGWEPPDAGELGRFLTGVAAGTAEVVTLPVLPVGGALGAAQDPPVAAAGGVLGEEVYRPVLAEMRLLVAQAMPGAVSPSGTGPRVQLLNPTGRRDIALLATARLVYAGAQLVIAGDTDTDVPPLTRVVYYSTSSRPGADLVHRALQTGEVVQEQQTVEGLDVTVVIGEDIEASAAATATTASATTTTTVQGEDDPG